MSREYSFAGTDGDIVASSRVLYTPSAFARAHLFYLQEAGSLEARRPHTSQRKGLRSYLFFVVKEGRGSLFYENREQELTKGDCVFLDCREPYYHRTDPKELWSLSWVHFDGSAMQQIYGQYKERGGQVSFHPACAEPFSEACENIFRAASGPEESVRDMRINSTISALLALLLEGSRNTGEGMRLRQRRDLTPVREYLEEHYREKISLEELSGRFFINKYYLTKAFRDQFGQSVTAYLLGLRITQAKRELRFGHEKLETIGLSCGLGALSYFSRTFKRAEGISPSEYREKWQG